MGSRVACRNREFSERNASAEIKISIDRKSVV